MTFSFGLSPWLLVASAVLAGALSFWLYRRTTPEISRSKQLALGLLRFGALFLILFLLFEPIMRLIDREEKRPIVAVLIDDSESLRITSTTDSTLMGLRSRVQDLLRQLPAAARDADVQFYRFGSEIDVEPVRSIEPDSLTFDAGRTNIAAALEGVRDRLRDENFSAVVLVSDGRYNTGRNPLYVSDRYPVPIFTAVVGDTARQVDLQIRRVTTNDIAYVGTELPVQVGVRSEGMGGRQVTVSLIRDGSVASSQRITLPEGNSEVTVDLSLEPDREGLHRYTVVVTQLPEEVTHRNNQESVAVRVLDSKRRALLLAPGPGPDVSAIRQLVADDPTLEVSAFIQKDPTTFYGPPLPSSLEEFDVILLVGYPGMAADEATMQRVSAAATGGKPIFFVLTSGTSIRDLNQYFSDVLPVRADRIRESYIEAAFVPTPAGANHPILNIAGASPEAWLRFPPLGFSQTRWSTSPDAEVLATTSVRGVELDDPLLVIRRRSGSRSAALLGTGTWRWRNVPEDMEQLQHVWPALLSNTIQWLTARQDDRPVRVVPVRDLFGGGESVQLSGQVYDESLNPVPDASLELQITAPDGTVYPYVMNPIGNGRYTLAAGTFPEGTYQFEAVATRDEQTLGSDRGSFAIGSLTLEYKETSADAALMRQIAQRSGGEMLSTSAEDPVISPLSSSANLSSLVVEHETEIELRRRHIFLALIVVLLTTEWFIRKRSGMV